MKQIWLTINEFYEFKEIAKFFEATYCKGMVLIQADEEVLESLGYL